MGYFAPIVAILGTLLPAPASPPVAGVEDKEYREAERQHWSFLKPIRPEVPTFSESADRAWIQNEVDSFILASLKMHGLRPAPEADRQTLVRRLYFDLTGLPPSPGEVSEFVADRSDDAYEKLIDRLLASPLYGERW